MGKTLPLFLYRLHFASVFEEKDGFDIVIANPPYVRHERIPQEMLKALKAAYPAAQHGRADLYVYFYARALELVREGGTLAFISSNKFFHAGYGKGLCNLLTNQTQAHVVLDFGDAPVFDAAAYPCIVLVTRDKPASDHTYRGLTASNQIDLDKLDTIFKNEAQKLPQAQGVQPPASSSSASALVQKLMRMGTPLGEYITSKMYRGIITGLNDAFVIDQATHDRLVAENPPSANVLKPFLRGRDLDRYAVHLAGRWLIRIENGWTHTAMGTKSKPTETQAWEFFSDRYPAIAAYLEPFAEKARKRDDQGQFWWELRACIYYKELEEPKIIYPDIAPRAEFSWDESGFYGANTTYFLATKKRYLCGLLNSTLIAFFYASLPNGIRGGYYRFFTEHVSQVPIVEPSSADQARLVVLVDQLQALGGQGLEAAALEREIDDIIYRTYGLTDEDIAEIERWHSERQAQLSQGKRKQRTAIDEGEEEA